MISLIAFLGNYGEKYRLTRHNVAWQFAETFLPSANWTKKFKGDFYSAESADFSATEIDGILPKTSQNHKVFFLKPLTLMNLSGDSIIEAANFYKIAADEILVVHDELELPFGVVSLKFGGGLGGHNGLRSTASNLGTAEFWRFRFGIGRPENQGVADYVLSPFSQAEREINAKNFTKAAAFFSSIIRTEAQPFLKSWSKKNLQ